MLHKFRGNSVLHSTEIKDKKEIHTQKNNCLQIITKNIVLIIYINMLSRKDEKKKQNNGRLKRSLL